MCAIKEDFLKIDSEKCVNCGLCVKDCMMGCLKLDDKKIPVLRKKAENFCIKCQHCFAICPTGALSLFDKSSADSEAVLGNYNSAEILNLIKSRRSFRQYKKENLDNETMNKLKSMLHFVPTGVNNHALSFSFIDDVEVMNEFRDKVNQKLIHIFTKSPLKIAAKKFASYKNAILRGDDLVFRGAPHLVVVSAPLDSPCADIDPIIALSYFELYAQSLGVGTVWCGIAEYCIQIFPELSEYLEIPENYKASYVMLFGPPAVKYPRTIQPVPYNIVSVKKGFDKKIGFFKKIKRFFWNTRK